jgi:hypothetical protein
VDFKREKRESNFGVESIPDDDLLVSLGIEYRSTGRQIDEQTDRHEGWQEDRQTNRQTNRKTRRQKGRQAGRKEGRQAYRQAGRYIQKNRQRDNFLVGAMALN